MLSLTRGGNVGRKAWTGLAIAGLEPSLVQPFGVRCHSAQVVPGQVECTVRVLFYGPFCQIATRVRHQL